MNWILGEAVRITSTGMVARDAEERPAERVPQCVPDPPRLPVIDQPPGEPIHQVVTRLDGLKQDGAAIGARVLLTERGDEGFGEEVRQEDGLWYRIETQAKASVVEQGIC